MLSNISSLTRKFPKKYVPPTNTIRKRPYVMYLVESFDENIKSVRIGDCSKIEFKDNVDLFFQHSTQLYLWHVEKGNYENKLFKNKFKSSNLLFDLYSKDHCPDYIQYLTDRNGNPDKFINP